MMMLSIVVKFIWLSSCPLRQPSQVPVNAIDPLLQEHQVSVDNVDGLIEISDIALQLGHAGWQPVKRHKAADARPHGEPMV